MIERVIARSVICYSHKFSVAGNNCRAESDSLTVEDSGTSGLCLEVFFCILYVFMTRGRLRTNTSNVFAFLQLLPSSTYNSSIAFPTTLAKSSARFLLAQQPSLQHCCLRSFRLGSVAGDSYLPRSFALYVGNFATATPPSRPHICTISSWLAAGALHVRTFFRWPVRVERSSLTD